MFKLQLVFGLLVGIQINVIRAKDQIKATATLGDATFDITILGSPLDDQRDKIIDPINANFPYDVNPEEGGYRESDLLGRTALRSRSAYENKISLDTHHDKMIETENNNFPINGNPEEGKFVEGDLLIPATIPSHSSNENMKSLSSRSKNSIEIENNNFPIYGNPEEGEFIEGDLLNPSTVLNRNANENMNSLVSRSEKMNETEKNNFPINGNPEEGENIEGDLLLPPANSLYTSLVDTGSLWLGGLIPYELDGTFTQKDIRALLYAFDQYAAKTCVRFYPHTTENDFISIKRHGKDCSSYVGHLGGKQIVNLAPNCFRHGTIMHELMHVLGFLHEQNNYKRDKYVKIIYKNIRPGYKENYSKSSKKESKNLGVPYDYGSIMHYKADSFSINGEMTIVPLKKVPKGVTMGQREGFSRYDLLRINQRYQCDKLKSNRKVRTILSLV